MPQKPKGTASDPLVRLGIIEAQIVLILEALKNAGHPCPDSRGMRHATRAERTKDRERIQREDAQRADGITLAPPAPTESDRQAAADEYGVKATDAAGDGPLCRACGCTEADNWADLDLCEPCSEATPPPAAGEAAPTT